MTCENCGARFAADIEYCPVCGTRRDDFVPAPAAPSGMRKREFEEMEKGRFVREDGSLGHTWQTKKQGSPVATIVLFALFVFWDLTGFEGVELAIQLTFSALILLWLIPDIQLRKRNVNFLTSWHIVTMVILGVYLAADTVRLIVFGSASGYLSTAVVAGFFLLSRRTHLRSVPIRTYMGTDAYITQCPFTKKATPPQPAVPDAAKPEEVIL